MMWSAAILTLRPGAKAVIYIPPFSGRVFEVEVIAVSPGPAK